MSVSDPASNGGWAATYSDIILQEFAANKMSAFWSELLLVKNKFSGWLGYAFEDLNNKDQLAAKELKRTNCLMLEPTSSFSAQFSVCKIKYFQERLNGKTKFAELDRNRR
jgi:hypothetical protein